MPVRQCPLCDSAPVGETPTDGDRTHYRCDTCGGFEITGTVARLLEIGTFPKENRYRLSARIRRATMGGALLIITENTIEDVTNTAPPEHAPLDVLDELMLVIHKRTPSFAQAAIMLPTDYPLWGLQGSRELASYFGALKELGYISIKEKPPAGSWHCKLEMKGWERLAELRKVGRASAQAFVAMSFNTELDDAYSKGIEPGLLDAGWTAYRVDKQETSEKICDLILAQIRRSGLLVADYTEHRNGVYFEAGFTMGLGLPYVYTVRKDHMDKAHFDTRQYSHIVWETHEELREKLANRVRAIVGPPKKLA